MALYTTIDKINKINKINPLVPPLLENIHLYTKTNKSSTKINLSDILKWYPLIETLLTLHLTNDLILAQKIAMEFSFFCGDRILKTHNKYIKNDTYAQHTIQKSKNYMYKKSKKNADKLKSSFITRIGITPVFSGIQYCLTQAAFEVKHMAHSIACMCLEENINKKLKLPCRIAHHAALAMTYLKDINILNEESKLINLNNKYHGNVDQDEQAIQYRKLKSLLLNR